MVYSVGHLCGKHYALLPPLLLLVRQLRRQMEYKSLGSITFPIRIPGSWSGGHRADTQGSHMLQQCVRPNDFQVHLAASSLIVMGNKAR
jgi:hypothetical protein